MDSREGPSVSLPTLCAGSHGRGRCGCAIPLCKVSSLVHVGFLCACSELVVGGGRDEPSSLVLARFNLPQINFNKRSSVLR